MAVGAQERWNILVVDEYPLIREALSLLLSRALPRSTVFDTAPEHRASLLRAQVCAILYVLRPPYLKAMERLAELRRYFPLAPVILLSEALDAQVAMMVRSSGANRLLQLSDGIDDLVSAIRDALGGRPGFPPEQHTADRHGHYRFSPRQREVFDLLCEGKSNKEISLRLNMSCNTVRTHIVAIFDVLGVRNRTEAAIFGRQLI